MVFSTFKLLLSVSEIDCIAIEIEIGNVIENQHFAALFLNMLGCCDILCLSGFIGHNNTHL